MSLDKKHGRYCDECGRTIRKAHRVFQDKDYCSNCYPRVFVSMPCTQCGASARVHRLSQEPVVCRSCAQMGRVCIRCEKPIVKVGMISEGKPVCPSCVPHFRTPQPCTACGKMSTRLSAMPSIGIRDRLCESCRNKITHRTCSVCGKYRKVAGTFADDKPYCGACMSGSGKPAMHRCPDCDVELPGAGDGRCRSCLNRNRLEREAHLLAAAMTHEWLRPHCMRFAHWLWQRQPKSPQLMNIYRSHQPMIEQIDASFAEEGDMTAATLLNVFGTATLRRHLLVIQYFQDVLMVRISSLEKAEAADRERIRTTLLGSKRSPWCTVLHEYAAWLENERISIRTRSQYVATAEAFCRGVDLGDAPWDAKRARTYARLHPGQRTNLSKFFGYCTRVRGWDVVMPGSESGRARRSRAPSTLLSLKKLLRKVDEIGVDTADRMTLCRIMAKALGLKIATMQDVSATQFKDDAGGITLLLETEAILIPTELEGIARAYMERLGNPQCFVAGVHSEPGA